ncbi:MAG: hypothetical protein FJ267_08835 [Planctomycetes bacterium]|nr:hypothetical protein [Planctomycetota bacterium]
MLIFPKGSVERSKLPSFPKTYGSEIAAGANPARIGTNFGPSSELRRVGQLPIGGLANSNNPLSLPSEISERGSETGYGTNSLQAPLEPSIPPTLRLPNDSSTPANNLPQDQTPLLSSAPRIANTPFTGGAKVWKSSNIERSDSGNTDSTPSLDESQLSNQKLNSADSIDEGLDTLTTELDGNASQGNSSSSSFNVLQWAGILSAVVGLVILANSARRYFESNLNQSDINEPERVFLADEQEQLHIQGREKGLGQPTLLNDSKMETVNSDLMDSMPTTNSLFMGTSSISVIEQLKNRNEIGVAPPLQEVASQIDILPERDGQPRIDDQLSTQTLSEDTTLDRLVRNEFSLREEAISFPESMTLQGRIVPKPIRRLDQADENRLGNGPHFAMSNQSSESREFESSRLELDSHPTNEPRIKGPHFGRRRSTDKPITIGEANRAAASESQSSGPSTPLVDALRQLQGVRQS